MGQILLMNAALIGVAVILSMALGVLWYGPKGFGSLWEAEQPHRKFPEDFNKNAKKVMVASLADSAFFTIMILLLYHAYGLGGVAILAGAVTVGVYTNNSAKGGADRLAMIDAGFLLCQLLMVFVILMVMGRAPV